MWAIIELMGHVRLAGKVTEEERFGVKMGRIEIPMADGSFVTQFFGGSSVYRITPTEEQIARAIAKDSQGNPVSAWEMRHILPAPQQHASPPSNIDGLEDDEDYDYGDLL